MEAGWLIGRSPCWSVGFAAGGSLTSDSNGGPGNQSYISGYTLPSTGAYYIRVYRAGGSVGRIWAGCSASLT